MLRMRPETLMSSRRSEKWIKLILSSQYLNFQEKMKWQMIEGSDFFLKKSKNLNKVDWNQKDNKRT